MNEVYKGLTSNNFNKVAHLIEVSKIQPDLLENVMKQQIEKNHKTYQCPANIGRAKAHRQAIKFGYSQAEQSKPQPVCPCCNNILHKASVPLCEPTSSLTVEQQSNYEKYKLTLGVALFFTFIKTVGYYLLLITLLQSIFSLYANISIGGGCDEESQTVCERNIWNKLSTYNLSNRLDMLFIVQILVIAVSVLSIIFFIFRRKQQYQLSQSIGKYRKSEDEYTIFVSNIPIIYFPQKSQSNTVNEGLHYHAFIQKYFQEKVHKWAESRNQWNAAPGSPQYSFNKMITDYGGQLKSQDIVKSISLCYNLQSVEMLHRIRNDLIEEYNPKGQAKLDNSLMDDQKGRFHTASGKVDFINDCQLILSNQFAKDHSFIFNVTHFIGCAFVSFQYSHYKQFIIQHYNDNNSYLKQGISYMKAEEAAKPMHIYWRNMRITHNDRSKRICVSIIILTFILIFSFIVIFVAEYFKSHTEILGSEAGSISNLLVLVTTLWILLVNYILRRLSKRLTKYEKYTSQSNAQYAYAIKLILTQFINSAVFYYIATIICNQEPTHKGGLILQICFLFGLSNVLQILHGLINPVQLYSLITFSYKYNKRRNNDNVEQFQNILNQQCEHTQFDLIQQYSYYIHMAYLVCFYAFLIPLLVPSMVVFTFLLYWIDKINLFKRASFKSDCDFNVSQKMFKLLVISHLLLSVGAFLFSLEIRNQLNGIIIVPLALSGLYLLLVWILPQGIERKFLRRYQELSRKTYDQCVSNGNFKETYWTENPATRLVDERQLTKRRKNANPATIKIYE